MTGAKALENQQKWSDFMLEPDHRNEANNRQKVPIFAV
jgi:hypothetical protein